MILYHQEQYTLQHVTVKPLAFNVKGLSYAFYFPYKTEKGMGLTRIETTVSTNIDNIPGLAFNFSLANRMARRRIRRKTYLKHIYSKNCKKNLYLVLKNNNTCQHSNNTY